jgi:cytochrome c-type biogenesis protein CcmH/NrfG
LPGLRAAYLLAAVLLLLILPLGDTSVFLTLFVAVDLAAAALLLDRPATASRKVVEIGAATNVELFRRTVPALRSRRPAAIIEAQVAWRQAAEYRRRRGGAIRRA